MNVDQVACWINSLLRAECFDHKNERLRGESVV
jgi:hypothetical protein